MFLFCIVTLLGYIMSFVHRYDTIPENDFYCLLIFFRPT